MCTTRGPRKTWDGQALWIVSSNGDEVKGVIQ